MPRKRNAELGARERAGHASRRDRRADSSPASEPAPAVFPTGTPEEAGFDPVRLSRIGDALNREIAAGRMPGAVVAIARDNKLVFLQAYGYRDKAAGVRMTTDTIFNIASMTKPMTTVTALTLIEQGLLGLDEPVSAYLPERFTAMKVATLNEFGDAVASTAPASRAITLRDLMTHTSGLIYGGRGTTAVHRMYPGGSPSESYTEGPMRHHVLAKSTP